MQEIARMARVLSDETRLRILSALTEGDSTAAALANRLGLTPARVTDHLAALRAAGLVEVDADTRPRVYRADTARLGPAQTALAALSALAGARQVANAPSTHAAREVRRDTPLRRGRTCYDHLGGVAGVDLLDAMVARGWLVPEGPRPVYLLTLEGGQALSERGVELERRASSRRTFAYGCLDWTERRLHLGGGLGAAVRRALEGAGYLHRVKGTRVLEVARPLSEWLDGPAPEGGPDRGAEPALAGARG